MKRWAVGGFAFLLAAWAIVQPAQAQYGACGDIVRNSASVMLRIKGFQERNPQAFAMFDNCMRDSNQNADLCSFQVCFVSGLMNDWTCADLMASINTSIVQMNNNISRWQSNSCGSRDDLFRGVCQNLGAQC